MSTATKPEDIDEADIEIPGFDARQAIMEAFATPKDRRVVRFVIVPCEREFNDEGLVTLTQPPGSMPIEFGEEVVRRAPGTSLVLADGPDEADCGPYGVTLTEGMEWSKVFLVYVQVAQHLGWTLDSLTAHCAILSKDA